MLLRLIVKRPSGLVGWSRLAVGMCSAGCSADDLMSGVRFRDVAGLVEACTAVHYDPRGSRHETEALLADFHETSVPHRSYYVTNHTFHYGIVYAVSGDRSR